MTTQEQTSRQQRNAATAPDPRPLFAAALDQAGRLINDVTPEGLAGPTPCAEFSVRDLLGHLVAVERRVAHIARGGRPRDVTSKVTGVDDAGWMAAWQDARADLDAVLAEPGLLDRTMAHPAGELPARQALFNYFGEVVVHGWDLATALDRALELDQSLAAACVEPVKVFLPVEPRGGPIPFGPVVEVAHDAEPYDRLVGWMGRDPHWSPGS